MTKSTSPKLIAEFDKNANEVVRVQLTTYENTNLLDIRVWATFLSSAIVLYCRVEISSVRFKWLRRKANCH